jgi:ribonuclease P protein component
VRRGPISVRFVATPEPSRPRVAYAIGRGVGSAVRRNRVRRRLRAVVGAAETSGLLRAGAYLIGAGPEALTMPSAELEDAVRGALAEARGQ